NLVISCLQILKQGGKMKKNIVDLQKRKEHFQWVADSLEGKENELYVERDWYDNPTLISKEDAKKEVEQIRQ
ncbi:TPA: hypothetical protein ACQN82_000904, partial [Streptococcus pyogenes]